MPVTHDLQNPEVGEKEVWYSERILVEGADAETLRQGETVTLLNWGNITITTVTRYICIVMATVSLMSDYLGGGRLEGKVVSLAAELALESTDFKNTAKLTWLADCGHVQTTPTICYHFENLIMKGVLKPDDDFKDYINYNSKVTIAT